MLWLIKSIFYIILLLLSLAVAGIVFVAYFVDPNQYKSEIIQNIHESTGRPIQIDGKLQWTFFPVLGIKIEGLKLGNPPSFPEANFLSVQNAQISVATRPLLSREIQVGKITLNNLKLNLIRNVAGQVNWKNQAGKKLDSENKSQNDKIEHNSKFFKTAFMIGEVDLKNSSIVYDDEKQHKKIILDNIQFKSKNIGLNKLFPVETSFMINTDKISKPVAVILKSNMLMNLNKLRLQDLDATTNQYHWTGWLEMNFLKKDPSGLNGHINFSGKNGAFQGIDLYYYSDLADAMINQTQPTRQDTHQTPFNNIQGTLDIQNGVINNHDLLIDAQGINASGQGNINLLNQQLDYKISLQRLTSGSQIKPRGPAVPLVITGTFSDPKIRPDWTGIAVTQLKSQIKDQIEKHKDQIPESIQKGLQSLLGT
jgi:uncharacterized protein involved in outer membrane biogenesis